jgi:proteasome lid subunit RPN8/RPN11
MKRPLRFLKSQFSTIQAKAKLSALKQEHEICGLILFNGHFFELLQVRNKSKRGGGFSFYYREIRGIEKMARLYNHEIVGTFHSHPAGVATPGPSDLSNAVDDSIMLIYDVTGQSAALWHIKNRKSKRLQFVLL